MAARSLLKCEIADVTEKTSDRSAQYVEDAERRQASGSL